MSPGEIAKARGQMGQNDGRFWRMRFGECLRTLAETLGFAGEPGAHIVPGHHQRADRDEGQRTDLENQGGSLNLKPNFGEVFRQCFGIYNHGCKMQKAPETVFIAMAIKFKNRPKRSLTARGCPPAARSSASRSR
jgi:hypothetical protein